MLLHCGEGCTLLLDLYEDLMMITPILFLQYRIWEWRQTSSDRRKASFLGEFLRGVFNSMGIARQQNGHKPQVI